MLHLTGYTFATLGLHPGMGATYFLPRLVGQEQASRLLLTGEVRSQMKLGHNCIHFLAV
jgi:enoyl-CoA hydratase/carnithine racemase